MTNFVEHAGDPQVGDLATPLNSSAFSKAFIGNLPAYRKGLSAQRRGLEVGMAHGFFLFGPFVVTGPFRNTEYAATAGVLSAVGLVMVLTVALSLYAGATAFKPAPSVTTDTPPEDLGSKEGWGEFSSSFLIGGCGGAFFAYLIYITPHMDSLSGVAKGIWSTL
ncbi:MAG: photosystem I reaction center protein subunit XI [Leptolyngbya sp. SIO1D8]|nr:photosystem I reaction center protein subunit XI [Leptolyngbya sp. SIO1D8]